MRHTIVIELPDHTEADLAESVVTKAIENCTGLYSPRVRAKVIEYHREQMTELSDDDDYNDAYHPLAEEKLRTSLQVVAGTAHAPYLWRVLSEDFGKPGSYIIHFNYHFATDSVHCQVLRGVKGNTIIGRHETVFDTGRKAHDFTAEDALDFASGYIASHERSKA